VVIVEVVDPELEFGIGKLGQYWEARAVER